MLPTFFRISSFLFCWRKCGWVNDDGIFILGKLSQKEWRFCTIFPPFHSVSGFLSVWKKEQRLINLGFVKNNTAVLQSVRKKMGTGQCSRMRQMFNSDETTGDLISESDTELSECCFQKQTFVCSSNLIWNYPLAVLQTYELFCFIREPAWVQFIRDTQILFTNNLFYFFVLNK